MSTIDLRDPTTATVIIGGIAATMFFFCYVLVGNFRESKRTHEWINLHQPLHPSAIDLRLDAALRDAQEGFNVCDACNFENLKRNIFCTICGSPIDTSKKKRKDKLHAQRRLASASDNRRRQARALKRKEWARRLTSDGKLVWFRDGSQPGPEGIEKGIEARSYVLQFQGEPLAKEEVVEKSPGGGLRDGSTPDHVSLTIDDDVGEQSDGHTAHLSGTASAGGATPVNQVHSSGNMDQSPNDTNPDAADPQNDEKEAKRRPRIVLQTLEQTSQQLSDEIASHPSILLSSTSADPQRPAVVIKAESEFHEEPKLLVEHSQLNFPSKIAEFVTRTSTALLLSDQSFLKLKIRRDNLLQDSIEALAATPASCSRSPLRMTFVGEQGIDAGGVYREWLVLVSEQLVSREACIFKCVDSKDQAYYLNPTSGRDIGEYHLAHYFATGRLLGRVLLEGNTTGFHLALPLLKIIVGQPVTFSDLEFFDPEAYKSLRWVLNHNGVDALGLDFTTTEVTSKGEHVVVELVPGGQSIDVTDANKHEYVECKLKYLLFDSVASQLFAFLKGLYEVMPPELLMLFDAEELDYVLSGSDEIDVDDWERNSKYTADLIEHPVREWFWDLVREMPNEYRRRLLLFSTGSSRVPLAGFASLTSYDGRLCPFMLKGVDMAESGDYIHSHACFNRLDLPRYGKKKDLKAVLYGILDTDIYGFTTA